MCTADKTKRKNIIRTTCCIYSTTKTNTESSTKKGIWMFPNFTKNRRTCRRFFIDILNLCSAHSKDLHWFLKHCWPRSVLHSQLTQNWTRSGRLGAGQEAGVILDKTAAAAMVSFRPASSAPFPAAELHFSSFLPFERLLFSFFERPRTPCDEFSSDFKHSGHDRNLPCSRKQHPGSGYSFNRCCGHNNNEPVVNI